MDCPLGDLKILDFTYLLPGPAGTMMLADMGASVLKVENFRNPDYMRATPPFVNGVSAAYAHVNRGKKSLGIDLTRDGAVEIIYRLIREYDIVLEQFRPGVMERLGLGYARMREINGSIIYCSLTGYGQTGQYSDRAGHDINYVALSGADSYSGRKSTGPAPGAIQIADICGGAHHLVIAVLAAYIRRLKTGEGDYVDLSIADAVFSMTLFQTAGFLADGRIPGPESEMLNGALVYDYYRTADGRYLSVGPLEPKFFQEFCEKIGLAGHESMFSFDTDEARDLKRRVADTLSSKTMQQWIDIFRDSDSCVEPVYNLREALDNPPVGDREMIYRIKNPDGVEFTQIASPLKFRSGKYRAGFAGVSVGYHNTEVLRSVGYSENEISLLRDQGVIS